MSRVEGGPEASGYTPGLPRPIPAPERKQGQGYVGLWSFTIHRCRDTGDTFCSVHVCWTLSFSRCMAMTRNFG